MTRLPRSFTRARILAAMETLQADRGYPPTYDEIGKKVGRAKSCVAYHLDRMQAAGEIERSAHQARTARRKVR